MANNYPYSYQSQPPLSQPLVGQGSNSNPPKENKSLKVLLFAGLFIIVASIIVVFVILFRKHPPEITSPIKFGSSETVSGLLLVSEYQDALAFSTFSSDGKYFAYPTIANSIKVLEVESHTLVAEFKIGLNDIVVGISFMQDDKELTIATMFGILQVWSLETKSLISETNINDFIFGYGLTKDFKHAVLDLLSTAKIWSFEDGSIRNSISCSGGLKNSALSPDNKYISGIGYDENLYLWDFETAKLISQLGSETYSRSYFSHDSKYLVAVRSGLISIWSPETRKEVARISNDDEIYTLRISKNNKYIAVGTDDGVKIYELETGAVAGYYLSGDKVHALSISAENRYLFASGENSHLELINLETNTSKTGFAINEPLDFQSFEGNQKYLTGIDKNADIYLWKVLT